MATTTERAGPDARLPDVKVAVAAPGDPGAHRARLALRVALALFLILGSLMAARNHSPGHWDAVSNLVSARNVAEGRGFVSDVIQQLAAPEALPGPDTVRAPGIPYIAAAMFLLFGVAYWVPIVLNVLAVAGTALLVRQAAREARAGWVADVLAVMVVASHRTYEMRSLWNNNVLALLAALLLLLAVRHANGRLTGWRFAASLGVVAAFGFLVKQTFMLGVVPFAVGLLLTDLRQPLRARVLQSAAFLALFLLLAAPYWVSNVVRFGEPLYSPIQGLRLPTRYGLLGTDEFLRTVRFGAEPYSYGAIVEAIGARELLERELARWGDLVVETVMLNPFVLVLALASAALQRARDWRLHAAMVAVAIPPVFESTYWITERRYLFPLYVLLLFAVALGAREWRDWAGDGIRRALGLRLRRAAAAIAAGALLYALIPSARQWRWELIASRHPDPEWVPAVRALPEGAVVLATVPPLVSWYARRPSVIAPIGTREDLARVVAQYRPTHYLRSDPGHEVPAAPFAPGDATLLSAGEGWELYRVHLVAARPR